MSKKAKIISWMAVVAAIPFVLFLFIIALVFFMYFLEFFSIASENGYNYAVCESCNTKDAVIWSLIYYPILLITTVLPFIVTYFGIRLIYKKLIRQ
jgi:hypothetical protein